MRIGDLVENDDRPAVGALRQRREVRLLEQLGLEQHTLMHSILADQAVEGAKP